jgi:hypothetical protein
MMPPGLVYLNSWLEKDGDRCFRLMETDDPSLFGDWTDCWKDLVSFEVIELGAKSKEGTSPNENKPGPVDFARHAQEWITAWNAHDLARILGHYSEDVELISPLVGKLTGRSDATVRGKAALRDYFARGLETFPTLRFDFIRLYPGVGSCVLEYRSVNGLPSAEVVEFDGHGRVRRVLAHYCDETARC